MLRWSTTRCPENIAAHFIQVSGEPDGAFARAEHVTKIRVQVDRSTAAPMECRAVAAVWDAVSGELTVWDGTQAPISVRGGLASIFQPRRGQGAGDRARCRRRLRPEGAAVLSGRAAGPDGRHAARPAGQVYRGPAGEFRRLVAGAHADPRHRACGVEDRAR